MFIINKGTISLSPFQELVLKEQEERLNNLENALVDVVMMMGDVNA